MRGDPVRRKKADRLPGFIAVALVLAALLAAPAGAGEAVIKPPPRTVVEIGGTSVVLVAANDKIYAFVDRLEDNAPVTNAALSVVLADGSRLELSRVSGGQFVAPFRRSGHLQDGFVISLVSPDGTGDEAAVIVYEDPPLLAAPAVHFDLRNSAIALVGGPIGALVGTSFLRSLPARHAAHAHPATPGSNVTSQLRADDTNGPGH
jgi:hypothetical protein